MSCRGNCLTVLNDVAAAMHQAYLTHLPPMLYDARKPGDTAPKMKERRPSLYDLAGVEVFQQMWGSTALGFGGIGGAAMTTANVVIVHGPGQERAVYFGQRYAYLIERPNEQFFADVIKKHMANVEGAKKRYEKSTV